MQQTVQYIRASQELQRLVNDVCHQTDVARFQTAVIVQDNRQVKWVHEPENGTVQFAKVAVFFWNYFSGARVVELPILEFRYGLGRTGVVVVRKVEILRVGVRRGVRRAEEGKHRVL